MDSSGYINYDKNATIYRNKLVTFREEGRKPQARRQFIPLVEVIPPANAKLRLLTS